MSEAASPSGLQRFGSYFSVAALNLTTSSAGMHPRSFTSMPCALAHWRTSAVSSAVAGARRPPRAGRPRPPVHGHTVPASWWLLGHPSIDARC
jgi:hypothetical protein